MVTRTSHVGNQQGPTSKTSFRSESDPNRLWRTYAVSAGDEKRANRKTDEIRDRQREADAAHPQLLDTELTHDWHTKRSDEQAGDKSAEMGPVVDSGERGTDYGIDNEELETETTTQEVAG